MKKWILLFVGVVMLLTLAIAIGFLTLSRDITPPNTADLEVRRVEVADADNAYARMKVVADKFQWPDEDERLDAILVDGKSDPEHLAEFLARHEDLFPLIEQALACRVCQFPEVRRWDGTVEYQQKWRELARLLSLKLRYQRESGQLTEASQTCIQILRLGSLLQQRPEALVHFLIAVAVRGMGTHEARRLAANPDLSSESLAALAEQLADMRATDESLIRAFKKEYQLFSTTLDDIQAGKADENSVLGKPWGARFGYLFQPNETKRIMAEFSRHAIENAPRCVAERKPFDVERAAGLDREGAASTLAPNSIGRQCLAMLLPDGEVLLDVAARDKGDLAATRLVVACRRYEKDHGELPPTLNALVPDYLDAVPTDPYDGKPFRYVREKGTIYSVGTDLTDSAGSEVFPDYFQPAEGDEAPWDAEDAVFYIHGSPEKHESDKKAETDVPEGPSFVEPKDTGQASPTP